MNMFWLGWSVGVLTVCVPVGLFILGCLQFEKYRKICACGAIYTACPQDHLGIQYNERHQPMGKMFNCMKCHSTILWEGGER